MCAESLKELIQDVFSDWCSLEKLKEWKTGFSIKCPKSTTVVYVHKDDRRRSLFYTMKIKREITCVDCKVKIDAT